jgi:hypothetical protein
MHFGLIIHSSTIKILKILLLLLLLLDIKIIYLLIFRIKLVLLHQLVVLVISIKWRQSYFCLTQLFYFD